MTNINYIVCHNPESMNHFIDNNPEIADLFCYIMVGDIIKIQDYYNNMFFNYDILLPVVCGQNIEHNKSLLSFTAWYYLSKNNFPLPDYIGIFEYDTIFKVPINESNLKPNTITGFNKRELPDGMFLDMVCGFCALLSDREREKALQLPFWTASSNLIMPRQFLIDFVEWYMKFIPKILEIPNHPHFHERAINVFAANNGYNIEIADFVEHENLNSHKISLK